MATTITPVKTLTGTTGASGATGITAAAAAHNTAIATLVTNALAVSGVIASSISITPTTVTYNSDSNVIMMVTGVNYSTNVNS